MNRESGPESPPPTSPAVVNQVDKKFRPRILPVVKGQVVFRLSSLK